MNTNTIFIDKPQR